VHDFGEMVVSGNDDGEVHSVSTRRSE
jgi:hypothetical protein